MKRNACSLLSVALVGIWLAGCASHTPPTIRPSQYRGVIRIACVGDSITYGAGVEGRETNAYPAVLERLLGPRFQTRNFGVSGATLLRKGDLPYWKAAEFAAIDDFAPKVVIIKLGTNDSKPQNWKYQNEFVSDLRSMVDHFAKLPSQPKVWLCLPVPVYEDRWGITRRIVDEEISAAIQQVAEEKHLPVIDLHAALNNRPELFPDKIHPNAAGAALMAKTICAALTGK